jgi:hypothetical protein
MVTMNDPEAKNVRVSGDVEVAGYPDLGGTSTGEEGGDRWMGFCCVIGDRLFSSAMRTRAIPTADKTSSGKGRLSNLSLI